MKLRIASELLMDGMFRNGTIIYTTDGRKMTITSNVEVYDPPWAVWIDEDHEQIVIETLYDKDEEVVVQFTSERVASQLDDHEVTP